jgi:ribonuclease HII
LVINHHKPSFTEEKILKARGYRLIAGVDEAGRGALMGPVVAAAVIMPLNFRARWKGRVRDSKQLRPVERETLSEYIQDTAVSVGVGISPHYFIDSHGIIEATRRAMISAISRLVPSPEYVLIDYMHLPEIQFPQKGIVHGDSLCFSIACASIIAKVTRDNIVKEMDAEYPGYAFERHKGYGTREHLECLRRKGPCRVHRRSFRPVREALAGIV